MRKYLVIFLSLLIIWGVISCKKSSNEPEEKKDVDVYMSVTKTVDIATASTQATYWKNDKEITLQRGTEGNSNASGIAVIGSDVYVVGGRQFFGDNNRTYVACYWKNGVVHDLTAPEIGWSEITAVTSSGSDLYILGLYAEPVSGRYRKVYWKNGTAIDVNLRNPNNTELIDIAVNGNDVYIIGVTYDPGYKSTAIMWKNGVETKLPYLNIQQDFVVSITISGDNVYVVGGEKSADFSHYTLVYWKNGTIFSVDKDVIPTDIAVNGNDVYIVGYLNNYTLEYPAVFYKNQTLNGSVVEDGANLMGIQIINGDVYMVGVDKDYNPTYWKNRQQTTLYTSLGRKIANWDHKILVVPRN